MKVGFLLFAGLLSSLSSNRIDYLPTVQNERLAYVLSNLQILSETSPEQSKALRIRVLKVPAFGECDGTPQSCPKDELFVAVSGFDELPDQRVYQLPKRHRWRFGQWLSFPDGDGPTDYAEFTLECDDPMPHPTAIWWRTSRYHLKVNDHNGSFSVESAD